MSYLGTFHIDDYVGIPAATHRFSSGAAYAPSALTYSIYEEATTTGLDEDVDMTPASPFDSITGCYWVRRQLTAAAGFEAGKNYLVVVKATVDSVAAIQMHTFQVEAASVAQTGDAYAIVSNGTYGNSALEALVDDLETRLGTPSDLGSGATIAANLVDIEGQTDDIGVAGAGLSAVPWNAAWDAEVESEVDDALGGGTGTALTAIPWNAAWDAEVQSEAADALTAYDPPTNAEMEARTLVAANYATAAALTAVDDYVDTEVAAIKAVTDKLDTALELDGAVYRYTTNALEQAPTGGGAPTVEQIRQEMDANSTKLADILTDTGTTLDALIRDIPTVAEFEARTLVAADYTVVSDLGTVQTGDAYARLGAPAGASVSADIAAVKAQTAAIEADTQDLQTQVGTDGAGLTAVPWNAAWDAEVQSEAADALTAYDPPTKAELDSAVAPLATAAALATVDGIVDAILVDTGTTLQGELDGIQADTEDLQTQIGVAGAGLTAVPWNAAWDAEVATAVRTELATELAEISDTNDVVNHADYGNAKLVRSTTPANTLTVDASHQALALTNAVTNDAITAAAIATGAIDADALAADTITAAKLHADVTTELQAGLATATAALILATPANKLLTDAGGRVEVSGTKNTLDDLNDAAAAPTASDVADAVWDEALAGHAGAGTAGKALADVLVDTAEIGTAGAGLTNINLPDQTMNITGNITGNLSGSVGSVTGAVGSVTGAVGSVTGAVGSVTGAVGSIAAGGITAASIATGAIDADALAADGLAEIADAVWDEALAGHAGAGTAGATLSAASAPTVGEVADAVWDEALAGHLGVGSTGAALNAAGAAGDPWTTALPGAYGAGTAGDIIGNLVTDIGALTPAVAISATTAASVATGALAVRTHHSLSQAISSTYAGNLNAATKLWLAVKAEKDDTDAQAVIFIEKTAGLTVLAGAAYTTVAHGSLTIGGLAGAWTVTVALDEIATGLLTAYADGMLWAECKALVAGSTVAVWDGVCDISRGIVNAVT